MTEHARIGRMLEDAVRHNCADVPARLIYADWLEDDDQLQRAAQYRAVAQAMTEYMMHHEKAPSSLHWVRVVGPAPPTPENPSGEVSMILLLDGRPFEMYPIGGHHFIDRGSVDWIVWPGNQGELWGTGRNRAPGRWRHLWEVIIHRNGMPRHIFSRGQLSSEECVRTLREEIEPEGSPRGVDRACVRLTGSTSERDCLWLRARSGGWEIESE